MRMVSTRLLGLALVAVLIPFGNARAGSCEGAACLHLFESFSAEVRFANGDLTVTRYENSGVFAGPGGVGEQEASSVTHLYFSLFLEGQDDPVTCETNLPEVSFVIDSVLMNATLASTVPGCEVSLSWTGSDAVVIAPRAGADISPSSEEQPIAAGAGVTMTRLATAAGEILGNSVSSAQASLRRYTEACATTFFCPYISG